MDSNPQKGVGFAMPLAAHNLKEYLSGSALLLSQDDASGPAGLTLPVPSA